MNWKGTDIFYETSDGSWSGRSTVKFNYGS